MILRRALAVLLPLAEVTGKTLLDDSVKTEADARSKLQPVFPTLSKLDPADLDYVVKNHFWELATEIVGESHKQSVDLSFAVRKAVKDVRNKADELIRYLNPKYHEKQKVIPVFRWAQNDTHIFLTIKYSVKWDAPGAVNVKDPQVVFNDNVFSFTASGEHSGNKYEYTLDLDCFDAIDEADSTWSSSSVGRFTAILAKRRMRRSPVAHSEKTCGVTQKIYCPQNDKCLANCTTCGEWNVNATTGNFCSGPPKDKPSSISFTDVNLDMGAIEGDLKIEMSDTYHISSYVVMFGRTPAEEKSSDQMKVLADIPANRLNKTTKKAVTLEPILDLKTDEEMAFAVFPKNEFGVLQNATFKSIEDAFVPKSAPIKLSFSDTNGDVGKLSGDIVVYSDPFDTTIEDFALYFGKKGGRSRVSNDAYIANLRRSTNVTEAEMAIYTLSDKAIPAGAQTILAYSKNVHGELKDEYAIADIVDAQKPCAGSDRGSSVNCPPKVKTISEDVSPEENVISLVINFEKAKPKSTSLAVYLSTDKSCQKASNYKRANHTEQEGQVLLDKVELNGDAGESWRYTHLLVYTENSFGRSKYCSNTPFTDAGAPKDEEDAAGAAGEASSASGKKAEL
eukprot:g9268.t1